MTNEGTLYILSAPSGTGKSTLANRLLKEVANIQFSVSFTTRDPRKGDIEGKDYFFVDIEHFKQMIDEDAFAEWAEVYGNYYGTAKATIKSITDTGKDVLLDIDIQGAHNIKQIMPEAVSILIFPPEAKELKRRLVERGTDDMTTINHRLSHAANELKRFKDYDYIIINDKLDEAYFKLRDIIHAQRQRAEKMAFTCNNILQSFNEPR